MINFKRMVSIVVVFSLVLSSCGGNKNSRSGVSGLVRNVELSIFENDIKTVGTAGDVVRDGSTMKLVGSRFERCDLDSAVGGKEEVVCVNKGSTSTVRFKRMKYGDELFEGKDLQCALTGGGEGCGAPLLVTCESESDESGVCVSPEIRFYGTRMAVSRKQKKAAEEKKAKDKKERAGKYEKIKGATIDEGVAKARSIIGHCALGTDSSGEKNASECAKATGSFDNLSADIYDIYLKGVTDKDFKDAEENLKVCKERNTTFVDSWSGNDKRNRVCALEVARVNDLNERKEEYEKAAADYMKEIIEQEPALPKLLDLSDFDKGKAGDFSLLNHMKDGYWQRNGYFGGTLKGIWKLGKGAVSWWEYGVTRHVLPYLTWGKSLRGWAGVPALVVSNFLSSLISPAILPLAFGAYRLKHSTIFNVKDRYLYSKSKLEAGWKSKTSEFFMPFAPNLIIMAGFSIWNAVRSLVFAGNGPEVSVGDVMKESSSHNALELGSIGVAEIVAMQLDREFYRKDEIWSWITKKKRVEVPEPDPSSLKDKEREEGGGGGGETDDGKGGKGEKEKGKKEGDLGGGAGKTDDGKGGEGDKKEEKKELGDDGKKEGITSPPEKIKSTSPPPAEKVKSLEPQPQPPHEERIKSPSEYETQPPLQPGSDEAAADAAVLAQQLAQARVALQPPLQHVPLPPFSVIPPSRGGVPPPPPSSASLSSSSSSPSSPAAIITTTPSSVVISPPDSSSSPSVTVSSGPSSSGAVPPPPPSSASLSSSSSSPSSPAAAIITTTPSSVVISPPDSSSSPSGSPSVTVSSDPSSSGAVPPPPSSSVASLSSSSSSSSLSDSASSSIGTDTSGVDASGAGGVPPSLSEPALHSATDPSVLHSVDPSGSTLLPSPREKGKTPPPPSSSSSSSSSSPSGSPLIPSSRPVSLAASLALPSPREKGKTPPPSSSSSSSSYSPSRSPLIPSSRPVSLAASLVLPSPAAVPTPKAPTVPTAKAKAAAVAKAKAAAKADADAALLSGASSASGVQPPGSSSGSASSSIGTGTSGVLDATALLSGEGGKEKDEKEGDLGGGEGGAGGASGADGAHKLSVW
ncbi:MAG: hypothetical protein LE180_01605 [Endomicrobium sp.]|uniref:hypothetical protein n=1 Tax=Candidatus Endomicrobiellum pyrsonymphae TaxID=1408203 RepID=UPI00357804BF|nr:hypothetical protein [Endomicrobium sp.]